MTLAHRLTRVTTHLRTFLDLPTPLDEDQDEYWTALPGGARSAVRAR